MPVHRREPLSQPEQSQAFFREHLLLKLHQIHGRLTLVPSNVALIISGYEFSNL